MTDLQKIKIAVTTLISVGVGKNQAEIGKLLGYTSASSFSQILNGKVGIPGNLISKLIELDSSVEKIFKEQVDEKQPVTGEQGNIPMYNFMGAASGVEMYNDNSHKVIGYLSFPGIHKNSFALRVFGHSMSPTLENGTWAVLRPITNKQDIVWGQVYYVEWGDYRMFKRLLKSDNDDEVILWSDNQEEKINERPIHSPIVIKKNAIISLNLQTDKYIKDNH